MHQKAYGRSSAWNQTVDFGETILSWDTRVCSGCVYCLSLACSSDSTELTNAETSSESTPAMIWKRFSFRRATMSTNERLRADSGDRPSSIIRETRAETAARRDGQPALPMGGVVGLPTAISKRRDANAQTSAVGGHPSPENGSTAPVSRRIGLKSAI
jgi:hypothetical protein